MHNESVLCIEPSLRKTITFTPESVVISNLNYDYLSKIKYHFLHTIINVLR